MHDDRCFAATGAVLLTVILAFAGCSDSESRQDSEQLRDKTAQAREQAADIPAAAPKRDAAAMVDQQARRRDEVARQAVRAWVGLAPGRELILVDLGQLEMQLQTWRECREILAAIEDGMVDMAGEVAYEGVEGEFRDLERIAEADLPPVPSTSAAELEREYWDREQAKRQIVDHLDELARKARGDEPGAVREFFEPAFVSMAAEALTFYAQGDVARLELLTGSDEEAGALVEQWAADASARREIINDWLVERERRRIGEALRTVRAAMGPGEAAEFERTANRALAGYFGGDVQTVIGYLRAADGAARRELARMVDQAAEEGAAAVPESVRERIADMLREPDRREEVVSRMRLGADDLALPELGIDEAAMARLGESEQQLRSALSAHGAADEADKANAQAMLAWVTARQAAHHAAAVRAAGQGVGEAATEVRRASLRVRQLHTHAAREAELVSGQSGQLAEKIDAAEQQVRKAESRVSELTSQLSAHQRDLRDAEASAAALAGEASQAYTLARTANTHEARDEARKRFNELQTQANEAARRADELDAQVGSTKLALDLAQIELDEVRKILEVRTAARGQGKAWREGRMDHWRRYRTRLAGARMEMVAALERVVGRQQAMSEAREGAVTAYETAATEAEKLTEPGEEPTLLRARKAAIMDWELESLGVAADATTGAMAACEPAPVPEGVAVTETAPSRQRAEQLGAAVAGMVAGAADVRDAAMTQYDESARKLAAGQGDRVAATRMFVRAGQVAMGKLRLQQQGLHVAAEMVHSWAGSPAGPEVSRAWDTWQAAGEAADYVGVLKKRKAAADALVAAAKEGDLFSQVATVTALEAVLEMFADPAQVAEDANAKFNEAISQGNSAVKAAEPADRIEILDAMAAAFLAESRWASLKGGDRGAVWNEARDSALNEMLETQAPRQADRMPSLRRLRHMMGLETMAPEQEPAPPAPAPPLPGSEPDEGPDEGGEGTVPTPPAPPGGPTPGGGRRIPPSPGV